MTTRNWMVRIALCAVPVLLAGCFDEPPDRSDVVFDDALESGVVYQPFLNSKPDPVAVDATVVYSGNASMRYSVPSPGEPGGGVNSFSGGAITADVARDLSSYTALTFWARASRAVAFNSLGLANDNTGTSKYQTEWKGVPLTTDWTRYVVPIPSPAKLTAERGLMWLAAGAQGGTGFQVWFDDVKFETLDTGTWNPRPVMTAATKTLGATETYQIVGTAVTHTVEGGDVTQTVLPATFEYASSNPAAVTVSETGLVTAVGPGSSVISASLDGVDVPQQVTITVGAGSTPVAGPPVPTVDAANVIALYSDTYTPVAVDTFGTDWSNNSAGPRLSEVTLGGNKAQKYTDLLYAGIEFSGSKVVNATTMTHFHIDFWTFSGTNFKVKLVDFGPNGVFGPTGSSDDKEHELTFNAGSAPPLVTGQWISLDIPLSSFTGLTTRAHMAQIVLSSSTATVYVDNIYFHK